MTQPAGLGFRSHSGWAAVVAVSGSPLNPVVLERRRIEIADSTIMESKQPYHAAQRLDLLQAEALIRSCRDRSTILATEAVRGMLVDLEKRDHPVVAAGLLCGAGRTLPNLATTLRSHALIHTAEGEFFRDVLELACEPCALRLTRVKERELWDWSAIVFHLSSGELQRRIHELGRSLGPPWRQDEKMASLAAWIALAESYL